MRTFIAIALPKDIKERLTSIQDKLKKCGADIKWASPENIHLTLMFLGEVSRDKLNSVIKTTEEIMQDKFQFKIRLSTLGVFPNTKHPKVIWAGVEEGDREIRALNYSLKEKIEKLGMPKEENKFSSHITLGRTKSLTNKDALIDLLNSLKDEFCKERSEFIAGKITVFKSTLTPNGPVYEALKEISLMAI
ncbi:MAG: RNA 2',3'-cyclic phosphodiesterase [Candidatus Omnitrophica bacterium]|nr:RNA 2',3'-cyclic phosphodiesterase [Candidatus Omnitrophota bacterium]